MKLRHPEPQQVRERFLNSSSPARPTVIKNTAGAVCEVRIRVGVGFHK